MMCRFCSAEKRPAYPQEVVPGMWARLFFDFDESGRLFFYAEGEDTSDYYYPKFCPECGKDLR